MRELADNQKKESLQRRSRRSQTPLFVHSKLGRTEVSFHHEPYKVYVVLRLTRLMPTFSASSSSSGSTHFLVLYDLRIMGTILKAWWCVCDVMITIRPTKDVGKGSWIAEYIYTVTICDKVYSCYVALTILEMKTDSVQRYYYIQ